MAAMVLGAAAVVTGGVAFRIWGLAVGAVVAAGGLMWSASDGFGARKRKRRDSQLTDEELATFEEIVSMLDEGRS